MLGGEDRSTKTEQFGHVYDLCFALLRSNPTAIPGFKQQ
jgi:hypothetical protein